MGTLVLFHAHPDDESITTGGTAARAAAEGHRVVLVVATGGEHGEVPPDLAPGEELFWHYSTSMNEQGWSVPCDCGAPDCRGEIRSFCDLSVEDQARLRPLALAYLRG